MVRAEGILPARSSAHYFTVTIFDADVYRGHSLGFSVSFRLLLVNQDAALLEFHRS